MKSKYPGSELEVFKNARIWKTYWSSSIRPYIRGAVLEVGGGIGSNIPYVIHQHVQSISLLEPDRDLWQHAQSATPSQLQGIPIATYNGNIESLDRNRLFETILYIDVLELIE